MLAAGSIFALVLSAAAQTPPTSIIPPFTAPADTDPAATDEPEADEPAEEAAPAKTTDKAADKTADANDPDILKGIDVDKLDWSQLNSTDPYDPTRVAPKSAPKKAEANADPAWSSNPNANGTSAVSVKQSVWSFWDTRIGADMTVARQGVMTNAEQLSQRLANGGSLPESSGTAWAAITAPGVASVWDKTSVEARVDPGAEQSKLGTSLSKSVPLTDDYSLTQKNGYVVTQQGVVPVPGVISRPSRSYETDQSASLSINDTGTSFSAGQTLSTSDDKWLRKVGAEQKLFDGVTVSGSIGETAQGTANKSISAGYKRSW